MVRALRFRYKLYYGYDVLFMHGRRYCMSEVHMAQADGMHADTLGAALFLCSIKDALLG